MHKSSISVTDDRVLIIESQKNKFTKSGLIIPDSVTVTEDTGFSNLINTGTVVSKGIKCKFVNPGETVLFGKEECAKIELETEQYLVAREISVILSFNGNEIDRLNDDRYLIEIPERTNITSAGIYIPDNAVIKPVQGKILKAGNACSIEAGAQVIFGRSAGMNITFNKTNYLVVREPDIVAIIK